MALLLNTARPDEIDPADYDVIYFTGGHAVMWDFPDSEGLQRITRVIWERGGIVSPVCHGYCGLLNTKLSDGKLLVAGESGSPAFPGAKKCWPVLRSTCLTMARRK